MLIGIDASRALRAKHTGTERYSLEIIRHMLDLPEAAEHIWRLYTDAPPQTILFPHQTSGAPMPNVDLEILPTRRLWTHRSLSAEIMERPPDVLFIPAHVLPFVLPPWRLPPSVVTVHDLGYRYFPESYTRFQRYYLELSTRWNAAKAQRVIAISHSTANDLGRFYQTSSAKIRVIYEATQPVSRVSRSQQVAMRQRYRLESPYALFVSTIQPRKNLARLMQAYAQLHAQTSIIWDLVLAGKEGWLSRSLYRLATELDLADRIRFLGYIPEEERPALMSEAEFLCYPSLFEGFGLPILEAQSYGVPVMTANNSSLPEVAGDAAILVDPTDVDAIADAMLRLSQDEALRESLIKAGYENTKRFSWKKAARETLAVLEEAAKARE